MKIAGIIPARYASTRFPGKSLAVIGGKTVIQRVYEQAVQAVKLDYVIVATDDEAIFKHVESFGGKAVMTSVAHKNGTQRVNEAAGMLDDDFDVVINIQGDEPFIDPAKIDALAEVFADNAVEIASLYKRIDEDSDIFNENIVKVVMDNQYNALYFSRSALPFLRNIEKTKWIKSFDFYKHIGVYAYRRSVLKEIVDLQPSAIEKAESLEQLRWLSAGFKIKMVETKSDSIGIDTYDDLRKAMEFIEK